MERQYTFLQRVVQNKLQGIEHYYDAFEAELYLKEPLNKAEIEMLPFIKKAYTQWYLSLRLEITNAGAVFEFMRDFSFKTLHDWRTFDWHKVLPPQAAEEITEWIYLQMQEVLKIYVEGYHHLRSDALFSPQVSSSQSAWRLWFLEQIKDCADDLLQQAYLEKETSTNELIRSLKTQRNASSLRGQIRYELNASGFEDKERLNVANQLIQTNKDVTASSLRFLFDSRLEKENLAILELLQEKRRMTEEHKIFEKRIVWMRNYINKKGNALRAFALSLQAVPINQEEDSIFIGTISFEELIPNDSVRLFLDHILHFLLQRCQKLVAHDLELHMTGIQALQILGGRHEQIPKDFKADIEFVSSGVVNQLGRICSNPLHAAALIDMGIGIDEFLQNNLVKLEQSALFQRFLKLPVKFYLPQSNRQRHCYILGKTGSGKTELLKQLIHKDIVQGNGVFVLDPHGDLAEECIRFKIFEKKEIRERLVYISPEFIQQGYIPQYNPFDYEAKGVNVFAQRNAVSVRAKELADGVQAVFKSDFSYNMRTMLTNCILLLLELPNTNIGDLLRMLYPEGPGITPYSHYLDKHWNTMLQDYFEHVFPSKRLAMAKTAVITRFDDALSNQFIRHMFLAKKSSFQFSELLDEGKIIIVNARQGTLSSAGTTILGSLLTAELTIMALERANKPASERRPVFAYIDECQNFLNEKVDKLLAEARKYGVHLIMANQFLGQFDGMSRLKQSIFANTALKFCGSASAEDQATMSKELNYTFDKNTLLGKGRFICRTDPHPGMQIQVLDDLIPPLATNPNYVSKKVTDVWMKEQLQRYYKPFNTQTGKVEEIETPTKRNKSETPKEIGSDDFEPFIDEL